jgi:serine protease Do
MTSPKRKANKFLILTALCLFISTILCGCYNIEINGVKNAHVNEDGDLIITYFNGTEKNAGAIKGADNGTVNNNITISSQGGSDLSLATSKGLLSAVRVLSRFSSSIGQGAGVIYRLDKDKGDAYVITNYHVVSKTGEGISDNISLYIYGSERDDKTINAEYLGGSMYYDIAVLKVKGSNVLKNSNASAASVAEPDNIFVGDNAIAIGNPEGGGISATLGIISVDSETISIKSDDNTTQDFRVMRVDTAINHGNSGGGLFNSKGELIGIVNALSPADTLENIAFAIPISTACAVADSIIDHPDHDTLQRAMLGVTVQSIDSKAVYDSESGRTTILEKVSISQISSGSIAEGVLAEGDILKTISIGDREKQIKRRFNLIDFMLTARVGDTVDLKIERNGEEMTVSFVITEDCIVSY